MYIVFTRFSGMLVFTCTASMRWTVQIVYCQLATNSRLSLQPFPSYRLTRAGGIFGPQMAEYVISHIIAQERRFPEMVIDQQNKQW